MCPEFQKSTIFPECYSANLLCALPWDRNWSIKFAGRPTCFLLIHEIKLWRGVKVQTVEMKRRAFKS